MGLPENLFGSLAEVARICPPPAKLWGCEVKILVIFIPSNSPKSCGGKFGAPTLLPEPKALRINAESAQVV
jgi:hypothetical protein